MNDTYVNDTYVHMRDYTYVHMRDDTDVHMRDDTYVVAVTYILVTHNISPSRLTTE